jgi:hypothetical protein
MLGPLKGYIDILDEQLYINKLKENNEPVRFNPLRASSAGFCERALGYSYSEFLGKAKYEQELPNPDLMRLFDLGKSVEYSFIRHLYQVEAFQVKYKQQALTFMELSPNNMIEGSIDLVLYFGEHKCVADVKSKGTRFSNYRDDSWGQVDAELIEWSSVEKINDRVYWIENLDLFLEQCNDDFMKDNFYQLNLYANSAFLKERGVDHCCLFYYEKNKSRLREIRFKPSQKASDYVISKFGRVHNNVALRDLHFGLEELQRESPLGSMRCSFCRFKNDCRPNDDAKKAYFATWPKKEWPTEVTQLPNKNELETHYNFMKLYRQEGSKAEEHEEKLCKLLEDQQITKIKFMDGEIYETKLLQSPKPHFEMRRCKR